jgi:hypothetical protein
VLNNDTALMQSEAITTLNGWDHEHASAMWALMTLVITWFTQQMLISMTTYKHHCVDIVYVYWPHCLFNWYHCEFDSYSAMSITIYILLLIVVSISVFILFCYFLGITSSGLLKLEWFIRHFKWDSVTYFNYDTQHVIWFMIRGNS